MIVSMIVNDKLAQRVWLYLHGRQNLLPIVLRQVVGIGKSAGCLIFKGGLFLVLDLLVVFSFES